MTTAAIDDEAQGIGESKSFMDFFLSPSGWMHSFSALVGECFNDRIPAP